MLRGVMHLFAAGGGVWGSLRSSWNAQHESPTVTDDELQVQAWLPSCLTSMLAEVQSGTMQLPCASLQACKLDQQIFELPRPTVNCVLHRNMQAHATWYLVRGFQMVSLSVLTAGAGV
jgi:hypothetical protein